MKVIITLLIFFTSSIAIGEEIPKGGANDYRIAFVNYNPSEVVLLNTHYGFSTHIEFSPDELVGRIAVGDSAAWHIAKERNHIFIKPKDLMADTNMTVLTNRHTYNFVLIANNAKSPKAENMLFQVKYRYPDEKKRQAESERKVALLEERMTDDDPIIPQNWNYWIKGSESVSPISAYDDGRFTYLEFPPGMDIPAIFYEENNEESLINVHVNGNTVIVHKIAPKLILRKGSQVACLFNNSWKRASIGTPTGSTDPDVRRVIKKAEKK